MVQLRNILWFLIAKSFCLAFKNLHNLAPNLSYEASPTSQPRPQWPNSYTLARLLGSGKNTGQEIHLNNESGWDLNSRYVIYSWVTVGKSFSISELSVSSTV
jgi:hypothetical protein